MTFRTILTSTAAALLLAALPGVSGATFLPGPSGKIAFASGRPNSDFPNPNVADGDARIWVADYPDGTPVQVTTEPTPLIQHRHPNWSPDHTRIVYAAGEAGRQRNALWIVDLRTRAQTLLVAAPANADRTQDRASWSPDGTKIAYASGGKIFVKDASGATPAVQVTDGTDDERPVWTPDGRALYFDRGPVYNGTPGSGDRNIWLTFLGTPLGRGELLDVGMVDVDDWQPAISPDGRRLCYLRGPQSDNAQIWTANISHDVAADPTVLANDNAAGFGDLNCVWSPDGTRILYTRGAFTRGDLWTRDVSGNDPQELTALNFPMTHFDGNADWATNFTPVCDAADAAVAQNGFVSVPLSCVDPDAGAGAAPPTPTPIDSDGLALVASPAHGSLGSISNGKVIYAPAKDFTGTDTFTYTGSDETSNGADPQASSRPATVTIHVGASGRNDGQDRRPPTITAIALSHKRWRLGRALAHVARAPVGTIISFRLDEAGSARLSFERRSAGRRSGGRCVKPTRANRRGRRCTRFVAAGSLRALAATAGTNSIVFQGRLDRRHRLALGTYLVVVSAKDAAGNEARRTGPTFTIVAR